MVRSNIEKLNKINPNYPTMSKSDIRNFTFALMNDQFRLEFIRVFYPTVPDVISSCYNRHISNRIYGIKLWRKIAIELYVGFKLSKYLLPLQMMCLKYLDMMRLNMPQAPTAPKNPFIPSPTVQKHPHFILFGDICRPYIPMPGHQSDSYFT